MFLEGMSKPWWLAATIVWLVTVIALQYYRDLEFFTASRIGLVTGGLTALLVWYVVRRRRAQQPPPEQ